MNDSPMAIVHDLLQRGFDTRIHDGRICITPDNVPTDLLAALLRHREEVLKLLWSREEQKRHEATQYLAIRRFLPSFLEPIKLIDGQTGILWGVTGRGVHVSCCPGGPIITYRGDEVEMPDNEGT